MSRGSRLALAASALGLLGVNAPGCFDQAATLGLPCSTARSCGRGQSCIDGVCQDTGADPIYCPQVEGVVDLGDDFPAATMELVPTSALDVIGECGSLGGEQAVYLWRPPVSGDFAARMRVNQAFFQTQDALPPMHLRTGGCTGRLGICGFSPGGARSFAANQDEVVVLTLDSISPEVDPVAIGYSLVIDDADFCVNGGELAPAVPLRVQGTTRGSPNLLQPAKCEGVAGAGFGRDTSFSWTAPRDGTYAFSVASPDANVLLYLLSGDCGGSQLACATDATVSGVASATVPLLRAQTVVVSVDTGTEAADAQFELVIDEAFGCVASQRDLGFQFPPGGVVEAASKAESSPIITCAPAEAPELVYRYTAPATAFYSFSTVGSDAPVILSVLENSCSGAVVGCDQGAQPSIEQDRNGSVTIPLETGEDVILAAAPTESTGTVLLQLEQTACGSQLLATPLPITETGELQPRRDGELACAGNRPTPEDSVFTWRTSAAGTYEISVTTDDPAVEPLLYVLDNSCAGPPLECAQGASPTVQLALRAQQTIALGIAAPQNADPSNFTLSIRATP